MKLKNTEDKLFLIIIIALFMLLAIYTLNASDKEWKQTDNVIFLDDMSMEILPVVHHYEYLMICFTSGVIDTLSVIWANDGLIDTIYVGHLKGNWVFEK